MAETSRVVIRPRDLTSSMAVHDTLRKLGTGLSICKRLVEAHGSKTSASSGLGRGSTFNVELLRTAERPNQGRKPARDARELRAKV